MADGDPLATDTGPFGSPDASRADAADSYISISGAMPDLRDIAGRLRERIIIGKKGAGKTFYLRSLQRRMLDESRNSENKAISEASGWIIVRERYLLSSQEVIDFSRASKRVHAQLIKLNVYVDQAARSRELWTKVWECAILSSIYNMIKSPMGVKSLTECRRQLLSDPDLAEKRTYVKDFLNELAPSNSPVTHIKTFLTKHTKRTNDIRAYVDRPEWTLLHDIVTSVINNSSQIALFIDSIDDDFDQAPEPWLDCQEGLFRAIFSILNRGDVYSNRVHVIVALREIVFSSLLKSEHASRYLWDRHVNYISWDLVAARSFLFEKIKLLPDNNMVFSKAQVNDDPVGAWLGFITLENQKRNIQESSTNYILRHTRLLPRDIVLMGNAICSQIARRKGEGRQFSEGKLRQVVHEVARYVANEAILSSANEYISSADYVAEMLLSPRARSSILSSDQESKLGKPLHSMSEIDVEDVIKQIRSYIVFKIETLIKCIGYEKFDKQHLQAAIVKVELARVEDFDLTGKAAFYRFDNVLYRHGLLAYQKAENGIFRWKFSWRDTPTIDNSQLPGTESYYGFHSSLLDVFPDLILDDRGPVV